MEKYKQQFIEFMVRSEVLRFGDFVTKSGRKTPFFINTGNYHTGRQMTELGGYYAEAIHSCFGKGFDVLYGPAYKGIPLAVAASMTLASRFGHDVSFCFNRKEAKDHGEGGSLIGHPLHEDDRVVIIEDVVTAGTSVRQSVAFLKAFVPVRVQGLVVSVDRQEKGSGDLGALQQMQREFEMKTRAIVTLDEVVEHLYNREIDGVVVVDDAVKAAIEGYRRRYGASA
jgi:orotate phosphoribosyltransferase